MLLIDVQKWPDFYDEMLSGVDPYDPGQRGYVSAVSMVDDWINDQPDITLENLARHGRWILSGRKILCSKCKATFEELEEEELFEAKADLPYLCEIEKFCFNCGAKMDLDAEE